MAVMTIQDRYDDIAARSGLSEEIIRRVFKASRESLAVTLKQGERATLPGICTITPEIRNKINRVDGVIANYIKLKASPSSAMESELSKIAKFQSKAEDDENRLKEEEGLSRLNFSKADNKQYGIRTPQISALL